MAGAGTGQGPFLADEDRLCMHVRSGDVEDVMGELSRLYGQLRITDRLFACVADRALGCVLRVHPRSANPTGEGYSAKDDVCRTYLETPGVRGSLRVLVRMVSDPQCRGRAETIPQRAVLQLAGLLRSDDGEERRLVAELLAAVSGCPQQARTVLCGVSNELIGFLDGYRTHVGVDEALRVVCVLVRRRVASDEDMGVFLHQVILRVACVGSWGDSREAAAAIGLVCTHYPWAAGLSIRHLGRMFSSMAGETKAMAIGVVGTIVGGLSDREYAGVEDEVCSLVERAFESDHHLVVEAVASMLQQHRVRGVVARHAKTFVPRVFGAVYRASQRFWRAESMCAVVRSLGLLVEMDGEVFERSLRMYNARRHMGREHAVDGQKCRGIVGVLRGEVFRSRLMGRLLLSNSHDAELITSFSARI